MKLDPKKVVALVVDLQEKIAPATSAPEKLIERTRFLLAGLRVHNAPVVFTRQYPKGLGDVLPEIRELAPDATYFDKTAFSCLGDDAIRDFFARDERRDVLLFGIEAHICVAQTAIDLLELGKRVALVADCVDSRNEFDKVVALERMFRLGVEPTTAESVLFELTRDARASEFKAISNLATGKTKP